MAEKLITKSFERLLEKGKNRGFITYEELGKSLGKRGSSVENVEKAFIIELNTIRQEENQLKRQLDRLILAKEGYTNRLAQSLENPDKGSDEEKATS